MALIGQMPATLRYRLAMAGYQAALAAAEPQIWRYFRRRGGGDPMYLDHWDERRGEGAPFEADIWVHAVSLGEYRSAEPLIRRLLLAGQSVILTHATPAGRRASEKALADEIADGRVAIRFAPIDRTPYWKRFFALHRPRTGLVMEMEFWPGMISAAAASGVDLWLANSQVPGKSFPRALRLKRLLGTHPAALAHGVFAKSDRMAERFRALGAERVDAMGETRFDIPPPATHLEAARALTDRLQGRPVVTFASVVAGEEAVYLEAARALAAHEARPLVIWVPRAPEFFDATASRIGGAGLSLAQRSEVFDADLSLTGSLEDKDVLLGDSFGEMFFYLALAGAVSVGGGFVEKGAHNIIEPLALGKPVVTGPHIWTIEFPGEEARAAGVLTVCDSPGHLADMLIAALEDDPARYRAFHAAHAGASERIARAVLGQGAA
ncbi:3-deoxy-D-manno-octulosonic acid transferase [Alphaproteobacteria bacterium GH1-50]|uniref:3-deoxy-D-manno-octulosonic acid transferase n=1 Tax=Kangsaoukella pontilimi TaxID=2691042 RepID=A0A7C9MUV5_9RHOB|nr:glycosyltransferase N-terminal domain-containing protein [Kangsaoukella pontilimi]MXQ06414.1 3-deoxy-D-manno-octulosonic acid transferase [Kangsaoukella pontilimi]